MHPLACMEHGSLEKLFANFLDSLKNVNNLEIGLRCFGHQYNILPNRNCQDTKLEVAIGKPSVCVPLMKNTINRIVPKGTTPIAYTLEKCGDDFPTDGKTTRNIIILITDGI